MKHNFSLWYLPMPQQRFRVNIPEAPSPGFPVWLEGLFRNSFPSSPNSRPSSEKEGDKMVATPISHSQTASREFRRNERGEGGGIGGIWRGILMEIVVPDYNLAVNEGGRSSRARKSWNPPDKLAKFRPESLRAGFDKALCLEYRDLSRVPYWKMQRMTARRVCKSNCPHSSVGRTFGSISPWGESNQWAS